MDNEPVFSRVGYSNYGEIYDLYRRNLEDKAIMDEFSESAELYATPHMAKHRVLEMYENGRPERVGELIYPSKDFPAAVGLGWLALTSEELHTFDGRAFMGVNFSLFIEEAYRSEGLGKELSLKLMDDYLKMQQRSERWRNRTLWTGARAANTASVKMLGSLGFKKVGILERSPEYDVYTY